MTHEIRCKWTDFYPIESCPTRLLHGYEAMTESQWIRAGTGRKINPYGHYSEMTEEQRERKRESSRIWALNKRRSRHGLTTEE